MRGVNDVTDAVLPHAAAFSDALSRNAIYADLLNAMTTSEAIMTQIYEAQTRLAWRLVGQVTPAERRERDEHAARRRELARAGRITATSRHRRPEVFWHEAGSGPVLLLLNGWTASGLTWPGAWLETLQRQFRVVRIDNRGTGFSRTAPAPFTMSELADDAADVLAATGARSATVLGSSMGGMIAQELAIRRRDAVERLILVASRPPAPAHLAARSPAMFGLLRRPARRAA